MFIEIIGVIAILMALRAVITKDRAEKLLYINVIGFCVSALIALYIQTPFGLVLAATFFISSTIGANAIAWKMKLPLIRIWKSIRKINDYYFYG